MNKFCVYIHFRIDNHKAFYVGQGTILRPYARSRQNKMWNEIVKEAGGFFPIIVKSNLSKNEALELESELISILGNRVVNITTSSSLTKELSFDEFNDKFYVDNTSPTGLRYKKDIFVKKTKFFSSGDIAGGVSPDGSYQISHDYKCYKVHRIIYLLVTKSLDSSKVIDHIDGNNKNNNIENLREVSYRDNRRNLKKDKRNVSGITGVTSDAKGTCRASISADDVRYSRSFSISKYGKDEAFRLACEWREQKIKELNEQGAGYTDRHGT